MSLPNSPCQIWLVRHGQTEWNRIGRYQGQADEPLNAAGIAQAHELAARMAGEHFDAIFSSDLSRARMTAEIIAGSLGMSVSFDSRLREIDQGEWEGMYFTDIVSRFEEELVRHRGDPSNGPPGGESVTQVAQRAAAAAGDIARAYPGGKVLVVSHGLTISTLLAAARGTPLSQVYQTIPANLQIEIIAWKVLSPII
jgi:broad specificity phosphatase PhoE